MIPQAVALAIALALPGALATTAQAQDAVTRAQDASTLANGKIKIAVKDNDGGYRVPKDPKYNAARDRLMQRKVLERYSQFLSPLRLPATLWLFASETECNQEGSTSPHYNSANHSINMCYQFNEELEQVADSVLAAIKQNPKGFPVDVTRQEIIDGVYTAVLLHETGHALFDILDVPVFGREEDAADQMAAFIAVQFGKDVAREVIKGFAYFWLALGNPPTKPPDPNAPDYPKDKQAQCWMDPFCAFSDEHGTSWQRMYNGLCVAYGADPATFKDLVDAGWLPQDRARDCGAEYQLLKSAFATTVLPFVDQPQMTKVQSMKWLQ
jgi:hypothetical protein